MCTAIALNGINRFFGRTLDLDRVYNERVIITPRKFPLKFRYIRDIDEHYAFLGMATEISGFPLYYEATNEKGLSMAALNFTVNAKYFSKKEGCQNVASFEIIHYILSTCSNIDEVKKHLETINIVNLPFNEKISYSSLHWIISDRGQSITLEQTEEGLNVYDNKIEVLTNNPPFPFHIMNLGQYQNLGSDNPKNKLSEFSSQKSCGLGFGAVGLPGDMSSISRFVRIAFLKTNLEEKVSVAAFFSLMGTVNQLKGTVTADGKPHYTRYTSCCDTDNMIYYYTTAENARITAVKPDISDLNGEKLVCYEINSENDICISDAKIFI